MRELFNILFNQSVILMILLCVACNDVESQKEYERIILGENGYQLYYCVSLNEFLLISSSPRVAELFDQDHRGFLADWRIQADTLVFTHYINHQFLIRKPHDRLRDTVLIFYDKEMIPFEYGTPTKYLIKQDTLLRLEYVDPLFQKDSLELLKMPFVKAEKTLIELDIPYNRDTTKICKGG